MRAAVAAALAACVPPGKAPAVLRLAFHDAATFDAAAGDGGANGSIIHEARARPLGHARAFLSLSHNAVSFFASQLDRPESFGLKRGLRPVLDAREALRNTPAADVSLADLIQLAGAHAVALTGGPSIAVPLGRTDAASADPPNRMPAETLSGAALRAHFARAGLSTRELVALSGAHTIGGKGFGGPLVFDNTYYKTLLARPWADASASPEAREMAAHIGLPSDKSLPDDPECRVWIQRYADDQARWFEDFAAAYIKMGTLGAVWAPGVTPPAPETRV